MMHCWRKPETLIKSGLKLYKIWSEVWSDERRWRGRGSL